MKFKVPMLELELDAVHPDVVSVLRRLDEFSDERNYPDVVVTEVFRTREQMGERYWKKYAEELGLPEGEARAMGAKRWSWHLCGCAVDIRVRHYQPKQRARVFEFLQAICTIGPWEVVDHDIGSGSHIHIGRRDFEKRKTWEAQHHA